MFDDVEIRWSGVHEEAHDVEVVPIRGMMERRPAQVVEGIDGMTFCQEPPHPAEVAITSREVQRLVLEHVRERILVVGHGCVLRAPIGSYLRYSSRSANAPRLRA
jgi:hypothetical protein